MRQSAGLYSPVHEASTGMPGPSPIAFERVASAGVTNNSAYVQDAAPAKPIPLLSSLEEMLESEGPLALERLEWHRQLQSEPEDDWSRDTERQLREFAARQPEIKQVESLITCRVSQCELQLRDLRNSAPGTTGSPSGIISMRVRAKFSSMPGLAMGGTVDDLPFSLLFLNRPQSP